MTLLAPKLSSVDVLVEYSPSIKLDKDVYVTVPSDYTAYFASNEMYVAKISNCKEESLLRIVGKDFKGDDVKVAFIRNIPLSLEPWGFGELKVNDEKLHLSITIGCNGKYQLQITNPNRLLKAFSNNGSVTLKMVKDKTKPLIEPKVRPLLSKYFKEHGLNIYELDSHLDDIQVQIKKTLIKEDVYRDLGLRIKEFTLNGIYIPESEAARIHEAGKEVHHERDDELEEIKREIDSLKKSVEDTTYSDTIIEEIDNLRTELLSALDRKDKEDLIRLENELQGLKDKVEKEDE